MLYFLFVFFFNVNNLAKFLITVSVGTKDFHYCCTVNSASHGPKMLENIY